jgi:translation initiation factor 2 beta subunit (eIF-2beta)/eIF-5
LANDEIKNEIKDFLEFNENEAITYLNLWDIMKAVLREKYHISEYLQKETGESIH